MNTSGEPNVFDINYANLGSCFEPVGYYLTRYTNGLHKCDDSSSLRADAFPPEDDTYSSPVCSYYKYWHSSANGMEGAGNNYLWWDQFAAANRAAKVYVDGWKRAGGSTWDHSILSATCGNPNHFAICKLDSNGEDTGIWHEDPNCKSKDGKNLAYFHCATDSDYTPKAGDFFTKFGADGLSGGHVMIWAGTLPVISDYNGIDTWGGTIFQKGGPFQVVHASLPIDRIASGDINVVFGNVDHEKGESGNSSFLSTQTAILTLGM